MTQAYFSPERPLHLSFTHLVCRSAIEGNDQGTPWRLPSLGPPSSLQKVPYWPHWEQGAPLLIRHSRSWHLGGVSPGGDHGRDPDSFTRSICILGEQEQRMDLSHPVHADNCFLDPDTGECWREPPAYTYRDYRWVVSFSGVGTQRHKGCLAAGLGAGWGPHCLLLPFFISQWTPLPQ